MVAVLFKQSEMNAWLLCLFTKIIFMIRESSFSIIPRDVFF